nr:MAG TPA: hypothetical protein [Herelleviridae sp.]
MTYRNEHKHLQIECFSNVTFNRRDVVKHVLLLL